MTPPLVVTVLAAPSSDESIAGCVDGFAAALGVGETEPSACRTPVLVSGAATCSPTRLSTTRTATTPTDVAPTAATTHTTPRSSACRDAMGPVCAADG